MKTGRTIQELAAEIAAQATHKRDFVASTGSIVPKIDGDSLVLEIGDKGVYKPNSLAHDQIAEHTKIPKAYYDRMAKEAPDLLVSNIDRWFKKYPAPRLLRAFDSPSGGMGTNRAFLSNGYRTLDNVDFAEALLPAISDKQLEIMSCEITEKRLYIKAVDTRLFRDVPVGHRMGDGTHTLFDTCAPVLILSNSEVGYGRLVVETGVYTRGCTNMALWANGGLRKTHLGVRHAPLEGGAEDITALLSDDTKRLTDQALWGQVKDVITAGLDEGHFKTRCEKLSAVAENMIEGKVEKVVELAAKKFSFNDGERKSVLKHLITGGSLTQYGLHSAITRASQDVADYDRATEMEYLGGKVIELGKAEWRELALAA